jgi:TonB family protein
MSMATANKAAPKAPSGKAVPKILRACVVQGGKVLEEHRLRPKQSLTIGTAPKNTFAIADPSLPKSHTLFVHKGGHYELVFTEAMRGKVSPSGGGAPEDLAVLKGSKAQKKGSTYHLTLQENDRGKVVMGDATIIFQFVVPPPVPAKPRLPAAARGSLWKSIDWPYAAALGIVFVLEAPVVIGFQYADPPRELTLDDLAGSRFAELIVPDYKPEEKKEVPKEKGEGASEAKKAQAKAKQSGDDDDNPSEQAAKKAARKEGIRKEIAGKGILAILGTAGEGSAGGAVADVFSSGGIGGDLDGAFDGIAGVGLATAGSGRTTRGGGTGEAASIGGLATSGGGNVGLKGKSERKVGAVKASAPEVDGSLDSAAIARVVRGRMRSIQDCYEKELKRDPNLAGKIVIEFTIGESGRVDEASVVSNAMGSSAVGDCIVGRIRRWRFPTPDGGSVTVNYPFIFTSSS